VTPEIETEIPSLKLQLLKEEDAEELFLRVDQDREYLAWRVSWVGGITTKADTLKFARFCLESAVSGTGFHYALLLDGEIAGMVSSTIWRSSIAMRRWAIGSRSPKPGKGS
jgi:hypothetical protein